MTLRNHGGRQRAAASWRRITAACIALVFSFGMSRFFLVIPLGQFICLDMPPAKASAAPAPVAHTHSHGPGHAHDHGVAAVPASHAPAEDSGYTITHCKDTINGIALTPHQPLGSIERASFSMPPTISSTAVPAVFQLIDSFIPALFQPPRA